VRLLRFCARASLILAAAALAACSDDPESDTPADTASSTTAAASGAGGGGSGAGTASGTGGGGGAPDLPALADLEPGKLHVLKPGGETICSRGDEYAFFVFPGDPKKVIVEFEGGGACWDAFTCSVADAIFKDKVEVPPDGAALPGWYDHSNPAHPMKEWTHVYIPYCTGDIHWGDNVQTYGEGDKAFSINHKGAVNAGAALAWLYDQIAAPEKVFVTGCSAGGYGSIWWAPQVQKHYEGAKVYHFADSAAGVITKDFFEKSFPSWNAQKTFPSFLGNFEDAKTLPDLYNMIAAYFPERTYSQYTTILDENQTFYYVAMGGDGAEAWSQEMLGNLAAIAAESPNFRAFVAPGEQHCILPYDNFWTVEVGGTKLVDWLRDMVNDVPIESAFCDGCAPPTSAPPGGGGD
jgi:hypothetical protein